jgi:hypothetical protein
MTGIFIITVLDNKLNTNHLKLKKSIKCIPYLLHLQSFILRKKAV